MPKSVGTLCSFSLLHIAAFTKLLYGIGIHTLRLSEMLCHLVDSLYCLWVELLQQRQDLMPNAIAPILHIRIGAIGYISLMMCLQVLKNVPLGPR